MLKHSTTTPMWTGAVAAIVCIITLSGCNPAVLIVRNSVVKPDGHTTVEGYVHRKPMFPFLHDIPEQDVTFAADGQTLGSARTGKDGIAKMPAVVGNEARFVTAEAKVDGKVLTASAETFHWDPKKVILVIDIDNTICNWEVRKIFGGRTPTLIPVEDSKETLVRLAERFQILYVTARPRRILEASREWLAEHGFPPGPVLTSPGVTEETPTVEQKQENIMEIKRDWPKVLIGIGNKASDATAYGRCRMLSIIVRPQKEEDHGDHSIFMPSWLVIAKLFEANLETLASAEKLEAVIAGEQELKLPVFGFEERVKNEE